MSTKKWRTENREHILARKGEYRQEVKIEVLTYYGNGKLACIKCSFSNIDALCLDHINGNRAQERFDTGHMLYFKLKQEGFPKGYQTLCANCNLIKLIREDLKGDEDG